MVYVIRADEPFQKVEAQIMHAFEHRGFVVRNTFRFAPGVSLPLCGASRAAGLGQPSTTGTSPVDWPTPATAEAPRPRQHWCPVQRS